MQFEAINCGGKTDLGTLAVLIKNTKMLLSNDIGVSHLASALKTPVKLYFPASEPLKMDTTNRKRHRAILSAEARNPGLVFLSTAQLLS